jgi:translation initiation factor 2B subunit (eIF-2B alpha/beta/delta family)
MDRAGGGGGGDRADDCEEGANSPAAHTYSTVEEEEARTMGLLCSKSAKAAEELTAIVTALKRRKLVGSYEVAIRSCKLYRTILALVKFETVDRYVDLIRGVARILLAAQPSEVVSGCMARRVLFIMRDYAHSVAAASTDADPPEDMREAAAAYAQAVATLKMSKQQQQRAAADGGAAGAATAAGAGPADAAAAAATVADEAGLLDGGVNPELVTVLSAVQYRHIRSSILDDINTELIDALESDRRAPMAADYAEDHIHDKQARRCRRHPVHLPTLSHSRTRTHTTYYPTGHLYVRLLPRGAALPDSGGMGADLRQEIAQPGPSQEARL